MPKTLKIRKAPSYSANTFIVGAKKKGNDGNMWKIVENKKGIKRWLKISNAKTKQTIKSKRVLKLEKEPENVWGKNKNLEKFWSELASGKKLILVYTDNQIVNFKMPKTRQAINNKYTELENDNNIKAIITSARSTDTYESLYKKAKNKTPEEIVNNYKKYLTNYGNGDKNWYL